MSFPIREGHTISVAGKGVLFLYPLIGQEACVPLSAEGTARERNNQEKGGDRMSNKGNKGASALAAAISVIASGQVPKDRLIDLGKIQDDYSLVTDTFSVPIPRGSWLVLKHLLIEPCKNKECTCGHQVLKPGDRVAVVWAGKEAVVIGVITRI